MNCEPNVEAILRGWDSDTNFPSFVKVLMISLITNIAIRRLKYTYVGDR